MPSNEHSSKKLPAIDMKPELYFRSRTNAELIELLRWAGDIVADDIRTGERSMVDVEGCPLPIKSFIKACRFQLGRREYQLNETDGPGGAA